MTHCVNYIVAATNPQARFGYVIAESTEYPAMSGSNTIAVATALLETGMVSMTEPVTVLVWRHQPTYSHPLHLPERQATSVEFVNQPAFAYRTDVPLELEGFPTLTVDVAWGGMAYVLAQASELGFELTADEARDLCDVGQRLKMAAAEQIPVVHPVNPEFAGITQTDDRRPLGAP